MPTAGRPEDAPRATAVVHASWLRFRGATGIAPLDGQAGQRQGFPWRASLTELACPAACPVCSKRVVLKVCGQDGRRDKHETTRRDKNDKSDRADGTSSDHKWPSRGRRLHDKLWGATGVMTWYSSIRTTCSDHLKSPRVWGRHTTNRQPNGCILRCLPDCTLEMSERPLPISILPSGYRL
jgi:hypothetical protein